MNEPALSAKRIPIALMDSREIAKYGIPARRKHAIGLGRIQVSLLSKTAREVWRSAPSLPRPFLVCYPCGCSVHRT